MTLNPLIAPPEPFDALIFDCDGTLADTMPTHFIAWVESLRLFGGDITEGEFYEMAGVPTPEVIRILNAKHGYTMDVDAAHHDKEGRYVKLLPQITELTPVADIARAYKGRVPIAVASGGIRSVVTQTLTTLGLLELFDAIITADDVTHGKPAPDIFLLAAERLGASPAKCIVYEDGDAGLEAARRAGMRGIDVRVLG